MKPINCLVTATVAVALAVSVQAQVDCADWNTAAFFKAAEVSDVTRCLQADGNLKARDGLSGFTPLHFAARSETGKAVTALLEAGANLKARKDVVFGATGVYPVTVPGPKWKSWIRGEDTKRNLQHVKES